MSDPSFESYARRIAATGLTARGAFRVEPGDRVPPTATSDGERTLILIGNADPAFWPAFRQSAEFGDGLPHPLDRWSERIITELGRSLDGHALFPFKGPPYHPFQSWARRAETLYPSPLGMLIHPDYGLWHAYRGALIVNRRLHGLPDRSRAMSPCLSCADQPCLHTCPVDAFDGNAFDAGACAAHLSGPNRCMDEGCRARNACPAGKAFRYMRKQHRFHLAAFLRARSNEERDTTRCEHAPGSDIGDQ